MNKMPYYNQCSMKKWEHILMYFLFGILISGIVYLFYHIVPVSVVIGFLTAVYVEKMYAESTVKKRKKTLRLQFKDFFGFYECCCESRKCRDICCEISFR